MIESLSDRLGRCRGALAVGAVLAGGLSASGAAAAAADEPRARRQPNIVFILADDLGWTDLSSHGSTYYETPHIDRLVADGMRFTQAYTCSANCAPTRAALMTGQYGPRTGVYAVGGINRFDWQSRPLRPVDNVTNLPLEKVLVPQALKDAGYATAMFGKWHLGDAGEFHPGRRGFDEAIATAGRHFDFVTSPPVEYPEGQYLADFLTDKAVDFIRRKKDQPFFLYLPHFAVHGPHQAKPELVERFRKKPLPPGASPGGPGHHNPTYAAMISSVDESVGRVVRTLDELGLSDDTLVIFSSDNGGVGGYARAGIGRENGVTDNAPLRAGKRTFYEGGIRVPFVWKWPGRIRPGSTSDAVITSVDLYPTFLDVAAAQPPQGQVLDGVNLVPHLTTDSPVDRDAVYWHFPGYINAGPDVWLSLPVGVVRSGDYKLLEFFEDNRLELYDLKDDVGETRNLAERRPDLARSLHDKLVAWRQSLDAKMPTPNANRKPPARPRRRAAAAEDDAE